MKIIDRYTIQTNKRHSLGTGFLLASAPKLVELEAEIMACINCGDKDRDVVDLLRKQTWGLEEALQRIQGK